MIRHVIQDHSIFNDRDYEALHRHVFRDGYAGYKPTVKEIPNGDGKVDAEKRFAHVAPKYFTPGDDAEAKFLGMYLEEAHAVALKVAEAPHILQKHPGPLRYIKIAAEVAS